MELKERVEMDLVCEHFTGIDQVEVNGWNATVSRATGLKHSVLETFEHSGVNNLVCHYLMFKAGEKPVGRANLYEVSMDFKSMDQEMPESTVELINTWQPDFLNFSMIECGLFAMNGDGLVATSEKHLPSIIKETSKKLHQIGAEKQMDLLVFRDIPVERYRYYENVLAPEGYYPVAGFTNAVLNVEWDSLSDYLDSLRSKDRHKIKSAFKKQEQLGLKVEITSDYAHLAPDLAKLWANVNASSSDYNREQLDENFFREAGNRLSEDSEVILFYHGETLQAFMWNLIGDEDYHMADWGVDYEFPHYREANFYRVASVYSLQQAIDLKKKRMQLGMTNYNPKKFLGARMQPLVYFVKHNRRPELSSAVARMMTDAIQHPDTLDAYAEIPGFPSPMSDSEYKTTINRHTRKYAPDDILSVTEDDYGTDLLKMGGMYSFYPDNNNSQIDLSKPCFVDYTRFSEVSEKGASVLTAVGNYCSGPPFVSGQSGASQMAQDLLADLCDKESTQLFTSGSSMYASVFESLLNDQSMAFVDEQCNPLLIRAAEATGKPICFFRHTDYDHLKDLLEENRNTQNLIVTESVFALWGDTVELQELVKIKKRTGSRLHVDESMAFGLFGERGAGCAELQGLLEHVDIFTASLYAGFGLPGAFVAGPEKLIEHIRHQSPDLLLAPGVANVEAAMLIESLRLLHTKAVDREALLSSAGALANALSEADYAVNHNAAPIVSVTIGDYTMALAMQKKLLDKDIVVSSVGLPLVPEEMSSLQIKINHSIDASMIDRVVSAFEIMSSDIYGK